MSITIGRSNFTMRAQMTNSDATSNDNAGAAELEELLKLRDLTLRPVSAGLEDRSWILMLPAIPLGDFASMSTAWNR